MNCLNKNNIINIYISIYSKMEKIEEKKESNKNVFQDDMTT